MKKACLALVFCGILAMTPACGGSNGSDSVSASSGSSGSSGSGQPAYVGTWHIITQILLGGGTTAAVTMDLSGKNAQLIIGENSWVAMDNDPASGCESTTFSMTVANNTWESIITAENGICPYGGVGKTYTGLWAVDGAGKLSWTMGTLVTWIAEKVK